MKDEQGETTAAQFRLGKAQHMVDATTSGDLLRLHETLADFEGEYPGLFADRIEELLDSTKSLIMTMAEIAKAKEEKEG
jgi:hypothetical protein